MRLPRGRLRWVPHDHEVVNLSDPTLRQMAQFGYAIGVRFHFDLVPNEPQLPGMEEY